MDNAPDQPVVCLSWYDARAYAAWVGDRLPTQRESTEVGFLVGPADGDCRIDEIFGQRTWDTGLGSLLGWMD